MKVSDVLDNLMISFPISDLLLTYQDTKYFFFDSVQVKYLADFWGCGVHSCSLCDFVTC